MGLPKIGLEAILDDRNFQRGLGAYMRGVDQMQRRTDQVAHGIGGQFLTLGNGVLKAAGLVAGAVVGIASAGATALALVGKDAVQTSISIETAFAGVIKTTDGLTSDFGVLNEAGRELKQGFKDLAGEVPIAVEDLMRIGELGGQLGIGKDVLLDFTRTIADIGVSTDLTTEEAAMGFARFMNIMGTAQGEVGRVGSAIVDLGNNFATTEPEILAFAERIAGAGKIAGLTEADVLGIGAAMSSVGVQAEAGGTAVQKMLISMNTAVAGTTETVINNTAKIAQAEERLQDKTERLAIARQRLAETTAKTSASTRMQREKAVRDLEADIAAEQALLAGLQQTHGQTAEAMADSLKTFARVSGMTVDEFKAAWKEDAGAAFAAFVEGLRQEGDNAVAVLKELELGDQRLVRGFLSLANAGGLLDSALGRSAQAWEENTALTNEAAQRYATTASQQEILRNQVRNLKDDIGSALLPAWRGVLGVMGELAQKYGPAVVQFFQDSIVPAVEAVGRALNLLAQGDVSGALSELVGPETAAQILEVAGAIQEFIGQAAAFVVEHAEAFQTALTVIGAILAGAAIAAGVLQIAGAIKSLADPVTLIIAAVALLATAWVENWGGIQEKTQAVIDWLTPFVTGAIEAIRTFWADHGEQIMASLAAMWDWIVTAFQDSLAWLSQAVADTLEWVRAFWAKHGEDIMGIIEPMWDSIKAVFETVLGVIQGIVRAVQAAIKGDWYQFGAELRGITDTIFEGIKRIFENAYTAVIRIIKLLWETLRDLWVNNREKLWELTLQLVDKVVNAWKSIDWADVGRKVIDGIVNGIKAGVGRIRDAAVSVAKAAWEAAKGFLGISSPSKLFAEVGFAIPEGMADGIIAGSGEVIGALDELFQFAGGVSRLGSTAARMWEERFVDPLRDEMRQGASDLKDMEKERKKALGKMTAKEEAQLAKLVADWQKVQELQRAADEAGTLVSWRDLQWINAVDTAVGHYNATHKWTIEQEAARIKLTEEQERRTEELLAAEEKLAALRKQQADLQFLQDQIALLKMLREEGLDVADILGGMALGVDASLPDLIAAMTRALQAMVERAEQEMEIGSPSKVSAKRIGRPFVLGIGAGIMQAMRQLERVTLPEVTARLAGGWEQPTIRPPAGAALAGMSRTEIGGARTYELHIHTSAPVENVVADFHMLEALA